MFLAISACMLHRSPEQGDAILHSLRHQQALIIQALGNATEDHERYINVGQIVKSSSILVEVSLWHRDDIAVLLGNAGATALTLGDSH